MARQPSSTTMPQSNNAADSEYAIPASAWRMRDLPSNLRPREEVERVGAENVALDTLLAVLLRTGTRGLNVVDLARTVINRFGSLTALSSVPVEDLSSLPGMGKVKAQTLKVALEIGRRATSERVTPTNPIRSPRDVSEFMAEIARPLEQEVFWVLLLDAKNRLKRQPHVVSRGLLDASLVHPREVFRHAIANHAAAMILCHNHPSGDPTPSAEDLRVTRQLVSAGNIVDIRVLDHVVIGKGRREEGFEFSSMRESGLVDFGTGS